MSYDADKIAALTNQELTKLSANVQRLQESGSTLQRAEAERLAPLIADERARRKPKPRTPVRKKASTG